MNELTGAGMTRDVRLRETLMKNIRSGAPGPDQLGD
jgi:hypothetical protein